jgi:uncharacterized protein YbjT (DUF2867 family)
MEGHILVTGGNGFIGRHICITAASRNIPVVSISRSGKPKGSSNNYSHLIQWVEADVFKPETWSQYLNNCRAVIHCVAILFQDSSKNITHDRFIYQSACIAGNEAMKAHVPKFVFISAAIIPVFSSKSYNESKRKAEDYLSKQNFDLVILRPSLIYGKEKPLITSLSLAFNEFGKIPVLKKIVQPIRALSVEMLAKAAVIGATEQSVDGILNIDDIERISDQY